MRKWQSPTGRNKRKTGFTECINNKDPVYHASVPATIVRPALFVKRDIPTGACIKNRYSPDLPNEESRSEYTMKIFFLSDIHGRLSPGFPAAGQMADADLVVIGGDISHNGDAVGTSHVLARIEAINPRILAVHGNWDFIEVEDMLREKGYSLHGHGRMLDDIGFFGLGGSSPIPIRKRTEYSEEEILDILESGYGSIRDARKIILVSHVPPKGVRDRTFLGLRAGSRSLRKFIESHPVDLCLCGHIHEAWGVERFGSTIVANAGSFKTGRHITVDLGRDITVMTQRNKP